MTIELYYEFSIYATLLLILWIFRDLSLIIWARNMRKRNLQSPYISLLFIMGIILLSWSVFVFFIPNVRIIWPFSQAEIDFANTIWLIFAIVPFAIGTILGVVLSLYFHDIFHLDRKALSGPALLILGNLLSIIFLLVYSTLFNTIPSDVIYEIYLIELIISRVILLIGFVMLFWYSFHIKNNLFIIFVGLFLANSIMALIGIIDSLVLFNLLG